MLCGVYCIKNKVNGHRYVGSTEDLESRLQDHLYALRKGWHENNDLQNEFNLFGGKNFSATILEICPPSKRKKRERYFTAILKPEYNHSQIASSAEIRAKIKAGAYIPSAETRAKISAFQKGSVRSQEERAKISAALMGNQNGNNPSAKTRAKISAALLGNQNAKGCKRSKGTRAKLSAFKKEWWKKRNGNPAKKEKDLQNIQN